MMKKYLKISTITLAASALLFVTVSEVRQMTSGAEKEYAVKAGKHDFTPNAFPFPYFGVREYEFSIRFDSSAWWSIEDENYHHGTDIFDWNKVGGLTNYLSANNKQSVLIGWRPAPEYMVMEIAAYVNDASGKFKFGPARKIAVETSATGTIKQFGDVAYFNYGDTIVSMTAKKAFVTREVQAWFGGNRPAHKDMVIHIARNIR